MATKTKKAPTWLEARHTLLTASDAAAAIGLDPYKSPHQLWSEKMGATPTPAGEAARMGNVLEASILGEAEARLERGLVLPEFAQDMIDQERAEVLRLEHEGETKTLVRSKVYDGLGYSPDGFFEEWKPIPEVEDEQTAREGVGNVQAKSSGTEGWKDPDGNARTWSDDGVPTWVIVQTTVEAALAGFSWSCVPLLTGGRGGMRLRLFDVPTHPRAEELLEKLVLWRERHLIGGEEPDPAGTDGELAAWRRYHPEHEPGKIVTLPARFEGIAERYATLGERLGAWQKEREVLGNLLKVAAGDAEVARVEGTLIGFSCRTQTKKATRASTFRVLRRMKPGDVEKLAEQPDTETETPDEGLEA